MRHHENKSQRLLNSVAPLNDTWCTQCHASVSCENSPNTQHIERDQVRQNTLNPKMHLELAVGGRGGNVIVQVRGVVDFCARHETEPVCHDWQFAPPPVERGQPCPPSDCRVNVCWSLCVDVSLPLQSKKGAKTNRPVTSLWLPCKHNHM